MALIKKSDVKNHLSTRDRMGRSLYRPANQPAAGYPGKDPGPAAPARGTEQSSSLETPAVATPILVTAASKSASD